MTEIEQYIKTIVKMCEEIQRSNDSDYTKEYAKRRAYEDIRDIILDGGEEDGEA